MKKNSSGCKSLKASKKATKETNVSVGMDLGDKTSRYCMLNENGEVLREPSVGTTKKAMTQVFATMKPCCVAIEVGTHSPWVSRLLKSFGHEVIVANARQLQLISKSSRKNDRMDAQMLARLVRVDPRLLRPIRHRSEQAQEHLRVIRVGGGRSQETPKTFPRGRSLKVNGTSRWSAIGLIGNLGPKKYLTRAGFLMEAFTNPSCRFFG